MWKVILLTVDFIAITAALIFFFRTVNKYNPNMFKMSVAKYAPGKSKSTQEFLGFKNIKNNKIVVDDYTYVMGLMVDDIDLDMRSKSETDVIEVIAADFYNAMKGVNIEVETISRKVDIKQNIDFCRDNISRLQNDRMKEYGKYILDFVLKTTDSDFILDKKHYVIATYTYTPTESDASKLPNKAEIEETAYEALTMQLSVLGNHLSNNGHRPAILSSEALGEILYSIFNRDKSKRISLSRMLNAGHNNIIVSSNKEGVA